MLTGFWAPDRAGIVTGSRMMAGGREEKGYRWKGREGREVHWWVLLLRSHKMLFAQRYQKNEEATQKKEEVRDAERAPVMLMQGFGDFSEIYRHCCVTYNDGGAQRVLERTTPYRGALSSPRPILVGFRRSFRGIHG